MKPTKPVLLQVWNFDPDVRREMRARALRRGESTAVWLARAIRRQFGVEDAEIAKAIAKVKP